MLLWGPRYKFSLYFVLFFFLFEFEQHHIRYILLSLTNNYQPMHATKKLLLPQENYQKYFSLDISLKQNKPQDG